MWDLLLLGKTSLGIELAKRINGEIISADSMQIYKNLDIGTAKVTKEEMQGIPHHVIDVCDVQDSFSVADFQKICYDKINDIIKRGKTPIIVGGTGLYVSAVVDNMTFEDEKIDQKYRDYLYALAKLKSNEYVYQMLKNVDYESAETIHPNNLKRVIRALEIAKNSTKLKSEHIQDDRNNSIKKGNDYLFNTFYINFNRDTLNQRINKRIDVMMNQGLLDEAKKVYDMNLSLNCTCMQAIGYKEFFPYFLGKSTLEECIEKLKQETRKYAKRQETWFKNKLDVVSLDGESSINSKIEYILKIIN